MDIYAHAVDAVTQHLETTEEDADMENTEIASLLVGFAQIIGLVAVIFGDGPVEAILIGIAGFAAIVNLFLPSRPSVTWHRRLKLGAAICGVGLIVCAFVMVT